MFAVAGRGLGDDEVANAANGQWIMQVRPPLCKGFGGGRHQRHRDYRGSWLNPGEITNRNGTVEI